MSINYLHYSKFHLHLPALLTIEFPFLKLILRINLGDQFNECKFENHFLRAETICIFTLATKMEIYLLINVQLKNLM